MALPAEKLRYTFRDVLAWDEKEYAELIDGEVFLMAPPLREHQEISGEIFRQIANFLQGKPCKVYTAPFGVRLFQKDGDTPEDVDTYLLPDITVVCGESKLDKYGCKGAPDLVVEILSPSNRRHDRVVKLELYQRAGVREYWIVDPENQSVLVFRPEDGTLRPVEDYSRGDMAKAGVLDGCEIDLSRVFPEPTE